MFGVGDGAFEERRIVWNWVNEYLCWEYCVQLAEPNDDNDYFKIKSDVFQNLVECQTRNADSFHSQLMKFLVITNQLLEGDIIMNEKVNIKTSVDLLQKLCSASPHLKSYGKHIKTLLQSEEKNDEWKNVFTISRSILVKNLLELSPLPYLLQMVRNENNKNITDDNGQPSVKKIIEFIRNSPMERKTVISELKEKLIEDKIIKDILIKNNDRQVVSSPSSSFKSTKSDISSTTSCETVKNAADGKEQKENFQDDTVTEIKENSKATTSQYFPTPAPMPNIRTVVKRSCVKSLKRLNDFSKEYERNCPSPTSSTTSSIRSHDGIARKRLPWSVAEEELLVTGVQKYGVGHWRLILSDGGLQNRTVRDLYDKWKNITKYGHLKNINERLKKNYISKAVKLKCTNGSV